MTTYYWSRKPGKFIDVLTGDELKGVKFTGSVREWYETLVEVVLTATGYPKNEQVKTIKVGQEAFVVLCTSLLFKPEFEKPLERHGVLCHRFDVVKNDNMPKNQLCLYGENNNLISVIEILDMFVI